MTNEEIAVITQSILDTCFPNINIPNRYQVNGVNVYDVDEGRDFLGTVIANINSGDLNNIPASNNVDQAAFDKTFTLIKTLYDQSSAADAAARAFNILQIKQSAQDIEITLASLFDSQNSIIVGDKSRALAMLCQQYLKIAKDMYILNKANTALKHRALIYAETWAWQFCRVDCAAQRAAAEARYEKLTHELNP